MPEADGSDLGDVLRLAPVRCAEWDDRQGVVIVHRRTSRERGLRGVLGRLSYAMSPRRIRLDERGGFVWHGLDGSNTVAELAAGLRREFPDDVVDVERRLVQLLAMLEREGLIALPDQGS